MNTFQIHAQLSSAIRKASAMRLELESGRESLLRCLSCRFRYTCTQVYIQQLIRRLHPR